MTRRVRVALIGCGNIARAHVAGYLAHQEMVEVVAVCDEQRAAAEARAGDLGGALVVEEYRRLLERGDIDAVDLCLPHRSHAPVALEALAAGKHVLVEKPLCVSRAELDLLEQAVARSGRHLMAGQNQRFQPASQRARRLVEDGYLGRIFGACSDANQDLAASLPPDHWLTRRDLAGGGVVISVGVHNVDLLRYLIGDDVATAHASFANSTLNPSMDCEDVAAATLVFTGGAVANLTMLYAARGALWTQSWTLYGTEGSLRLWTRPDWQTQLLVRSDRLEGHQQQLAPLPGDDGAEFEPYRTSFLGEIHHFVECIRADREPLTSVRRVRNTMETVFAIYESAQSGQPQAVGSGAPGGQHA